MSDFFHITYVSSSKVDRYNVKLAHTYVDMAATDYSVWLDDEERPLPGRSHSISRMAAVGICSLSLFALVVVAQLSSQHPLMAAASPPLTCTRHVLVTGFSAWGNITSNPAEEVVLALDGSGRGGVCFKGLVLPVNRTGATTVAKELASGQVRWDAIVHLGLESISKGLRIETSAANVLAKDVGGGGWSAEIPCNKSEQTDSARQFDDIAPGESCLLATTAPLDIMELGESGPGLPQEIWSRGRSCAAA